jgi:hypothetical protein
VNADKNSELVNYDELIENYRISGGRHLRAMFQDEKYREDVFTVETFDVLEELLWFRGIKQRLKFHPQIKEFLKKSLLHELKKYHPDLDSRTLKLKADDIISLLENEAYAAQYFELPNDQGERKRTIESAANGLLKFIKQFEELDSEAQGHVIDSAIYSMMTAIGRKNHNELFFKVAGWILKHTCGVLMAAKAFAKGVENSAKTLPLSVQKTQGRKIHSHVANRIRIIFSMTGIRFKESEDGLAATCLREVLFLSGAVKPGSDDENKQLHNPIRKVKSKRTQTDKR